MSYPAGSSSPGLHSIPRVSPERYDYIVVGAGSAGCVLAGRLTEDPDIRLCLIEAGGSDLTPLVQIPMACALTVPTRLHNWALQTEPQPGLLGRRGYQPRGRVLGGSSSINAMVYIRGQHQDYDDWAAAGATGWSWNEVLPWFRHSEANSRGADPWHGADGPLHVSDLCSPNPALARFIEAGVSVGHVHNADFNGATQAGVGAYQVTQHRGQRWNAARAYLHPALGRPGLSLYSRTDCLRVIVERGRAIGVEIAHGNRREILYAEREVLLAAGAFGSPQLLLCSGIGPAQELTRHGIRVIHELPGVGENLHDHVDYVLSYASPNSDLFGYVPGALWRAATGLGDYYRRGNGLLTSNYAEGGAFLATDGGNRPDVQLHFVIAAVENHNRRPRWGYGYSCHVCVLRPKSRGRVQLRSADARIAPTIDPNFLGEDADVRTLLAGFHLSREIMRARPLAGLQGRERHTAGIEDSASLIHALRRRADTIYHPVGTCRMGADALAVVDPQLKVRGIDGLRVVDCAVMPTVVSGNTNAPAIMLAERAAALIRGSTIPMQ